MNDDDDDEYFRSIVPRMTEYFYLYYINKCICSKDGGTSRD